MAGAALEFLRILKIKSLIWNVIGEVKATATTHEAVLDSITV